MVGYVHLDLLNIDQYSLWFNFPEGPSSYVESVSLGGKRIDEHEGCSMEYVNFDAVSNRFEFRIPYGDCGMTGTANTIEGAE